MSTRRSGIVVALFLSIPSACTDPVQISAPVTANAGMTQFVARGDDVALDGRGSMGPEAGTFAWTFVATPTGSQATLEDADSATPRFLADVEGLFQVELTFTVGNITSKAQVGIVVVLRPSIALSPDLAVAVGQTATVEATATGTTGDALNYAWSIATKPTGSTASLTGTTSQSASFVADVAGTYVVDLVVTDHTVQSEPASVTVTASPR